MASLHEAFEGDMKLTFHVGAWPFAKKDKQTGKVQKGEAGQWLLKAFAIINRLRFLRGTIADPFRNNAEAQLARQVLADYEEDIDFAMANTHTDQELLSQLLDVPEQIRGYGHVRERHVKKTQQLRTKLRNEISHGQARAA